MCFCLPLLLTAQSANTGVDPQPLQHDKASSINQNTADPSGLVRATTLSPEQTDDHLLKRKGINLDEVLRKLGPDLITPRLTVDAKILQHLLSMLDVEPDVRLVLAVDHSALSVRYALVHKLLENLEAYPVVKPRVDIEMYAPISDYHTTWLYDRGLGHLMIRLEQSPR